MKSIITNQARRLIHCALAATLVCAAPLRAVELPSITSTSAIQASNIDVLTLTEAIRRTLATHPELQLLRTTEASLQAAAEIAAQKPALSVVADMENVAGTGDRSGIHGAEMTLSLASILERGGKREARQAIAASQLDALVVTREKTRLDLMAEVARRYLDVVRAQAQVRLSTEDVAQRARTVAAAARQVQAGASPESTRLLAEAAQARAELDRARAERETQAAYLRLALLWNERKPASSSVRGDLAALPEVPDIEALANFIDRTPELQQFADSTRLREARLQLARSARSPDVSWQVGVRRLQEGSDWAAVAGVTVPLGSARRAAPEIRSAQAELDALTIERQASELTLYATLAEAHGRYIAAKAEVEQVRAEVLPRLVRAEAVAEHAYRAGALSYLELAQVQSEITDIRRQQLTAAHEAQRALVEIQRLTGEPFIQSMPITQESAP